MLFFIVNDEEHVRHMLREMIEDNDLGQVVGEMRCGTYMDANMHAAYQADVVLVDYIMPKMDGLEFVQQLKKQGFNGIVVMISQVDSKDIISKAYSNGVDFYITKPLNKVEIIQILRKVEENIKLNKSLLQIQQMINQTVVGMNGKRLINHTESAERDLTAITKRLLNEIGMTGGSGYYDILEAIQSIYESEQQDRLLAEFPKLKDILTFITKQKLGKDAKNSAIHREAKAYEQRIRRGIKQSLVHFASMGLEDYGHPLFERYASILFEFQEVRKMMRALEEDEVTTTKFQINVKKFLQALYIEIKQELQENSHSYKEML